MPANSYFLIKMGSANAAVGIAMPNPDLTGTTNIGSISIKLALVNNTTLFTVADPSASSVDFLGTGPTVTGHEGAGSAPIASNTLSWLRQANATATAVSMAAGGADANAGNGWDADDNATDFVTESSILARNASVIVVLPVVFTGIRATEQGSGIDIGWTVAGEVGIGKYIVQKSSDGIVFNDVANISANSRGVGSAYTWTDATPVTGSKTYYRVKAVEISGNELYSIVVEINTSAGKSGIAVYPNPASGQMIILALDNKPKGTYTIDLFNAAGQKVYNRVLEHAGGSVTQQLAVNALMVKGIYMLRTSDGKNVTNQTLISR